MSSHEDGPRETSRSVDKVRIVRICVSSLLVTTSTWLGMAWSYLGWHRPTRPLVKLGMVYPLEYRSITVYVTKFEYMLAGPPMQYAAAAIAVAFMALAILLGRSERPSKLGKY
jgi:hypothetical protein